VQNNDKCHAGFGGRVLEKTTKGLQPAGGSAYTDDDEFGILHDRN